MQLGLPSVHASAELGSFGKPDTRVRSPSEGSNWSAPSNVFGKDTVVRVSGTRSEQNYSSKTDFETRKKTQDFGQQNISMSQPLLESTPFGTNTTNGTMSPIELIPVGKICQTLCH